VKKIAPELKFVDTHPKPDTQRDTLTPDISIYTIDNQPRGDAKTDFSKMDLFVELKSAARSDPFDDPPPHSKAGEFCFFEKDTNDARQTRGQLASYAAALTGSQFRVHNFCVLVCGTYARFILWDRVGAIVTQRFDYIKKPRFLAGFFWRYNSLDRLQKGYDTSVSDLPATPEDIRSIDTEDLKRLKADNPVYREFHILMVPDRDNPNVEKRFVVSFPPNYTACSPFGRATRPMLAFDMETSKIVFLKDYWRTDAEGTEKEGNIYALLEAKKVPNIWKGE
jgi:hypothetical protein